MKDQDFNVFLARKGHVCCPMGRHAPAFTEREIALHVGEEVPVDFDHKIDFFSSLANITFLFFGTTPLPACLFLYTAVQQKVYHRFDEGENLICFLFL